MAIVHVRIDYRLIHGQVATFWANYLKSTRIMVVDDETTTNDIKKAALKLATPPGVALSILTVDKATENFKNHKYDNQRVMMILGSIDTLKRLVNNEIEITEVNLGNLQKDENKKFVKPTIPLTAEEAEIIMDLNEKGIEFTYQLIPSKTAEEVIPSLKREFGL